MGRKHDPAPGYQVMWHGYAYLQLMCQGFKLAENDYERITYG